MSLYSFFLHIDFWRGNIPGKLTLDRLWLIWGSIIDWVDALTNPEVETRSSPLRAILTSPSTMAVVSTTVYRQQQYRKAHLVLVELVLLLLEVVECRVVLERHLRLGEPGQQPIHGALVLSPLAQSALQTLADVTHGRRQLARVKPNTSIYVSLTLRRWSLHNLGLRQYFSNCAPWYPGGPRSHFRCAARRRRILRKAKGQSTLSSPTKKIWWSQWTWFL